MSAVRNSNLDSSPLRVKKRRLFFVRFYIILFFLLVVVFGLAILSGNQKVKIQTILISGTASVSADEILTIVNRDLTGRYWYLFSRSNSLIFPRFQIAKDILIEIKAVKDLDISWSDWQKINIAITERKPHSVWCDQFDSDCFLVDKDGYIYNEAPLFSGSLFIKDYGLPSLGEGRMGSSTSPVGQYFLPTETYQQIFNLIQALDQNNLKVTAIFFDGFDFKFILEIGPEIIFNLTNDLNLSFVNLFTALETKNLDLVTDADRISYVDLRFANKIVVGKKIK